MAARPHRQHLPLHRPPRLLQRDRARRRGHDRATVKRLLGVGGLALWLAAPAAAAPPVVTATASPARGFAPLRVTLTAGGEPASYRWDLGDGTTAVGATVRHVYAPGTWAATVTATSAAGETAQAVVVVQAAPEALVLRRPAAARWGDAVALHGRVASGRAGVRVQVYRGRTFVTGATTRRGGSFAARLLLRVPGRYHARGGPFAIGRGRGACAPATARFAPPRRPARRSPHAPRRRRARMGGTTRGASRSRPAAAASDQLVLPTNRLGTVRVTLRLRPRPGFAGFTRALSSRIVEPSLGAGLERACRCASSSGACAGLRYALRGIDGRYDLDTVEAVYAFQQLHGLTPTGRTDARLWQLLARAETPTARFPGTHLEVDRGRQVLLDVRAGLVVRVVHVSTGATGNTPLGIWQRLPQGARASTGCCTTRSTSCAASPSTATPRCRRTRRRTAASACRCGSRRRFTPATTRARR